MITPPPGARVWLAAGFTDMRKGFDGLAMLVQEKLKRDAFGGQIFVFRGRRGYLLKALWWDGCPSSKILRHRAAQIKGGSGSFC